MRHQVVVRRAWMKHAEHCGRSYAFSVSTTVVRLRSAPRPVAARARDAVLVVEAAVEPHRRVEGAVLVGSRSQVSSASKASASFFGREVAAELLAGLADRARDAVHDLAHAGLALAWRRR